MAEICNILVVEDYDAIRALIAGAVKEEGYRFTSAATAAEARAAVARERFDIAIIDIILPGREDGMVLAAEFARLGIGIILTSGHPDGISRIRQGEGGHAFLLKPFRLAELIATVNRVLSAVSADCAPDPMPEASPIAGD